MTKEQTQPAILSARQLRYSYPERHVFAGWSAEFGPGLTWLRGVNGSGKSTLLQLLGGALAPLSGRLVVRDIDASIDPVGYRREVFYCGPGPIAFDHLRPLEFFAFMCGLYPRFDAAVLEAHVVAFRLAPQLDLRLAALSTGSQRKVWLAAALAAGTAAVLLDEPLNSLDDGAVAHLQSAFQRAAGDRDRAWIVASHEPLGEAGEHAAIVALAPPQS